MKINKMKVDNWVKVIAGSFVFVSAVLGYVHNKNWLWFTMFVGLNLFQFGFSDVCPLKILLKKFGVKE